ncbi:hypothetical protein DV517_38040 [Streptomyces sp. S816]|nr:hypothetical protein DV517_38040 [Streptomyces sp. S816]
MKAAAFVYPWDVNGDPDAPARIAGLGVEQVTLAAAYHSTRALTPRHPRHRVVTAEHAAVLYPPGDHWTGRTPRPYPAGRWAPGDAHGEAARALAGAGLAVHTWVVLAHNSRLGAEHPDTSVVNAYGDRYPWRPASPRRPPAPTSSTSPPRPPYAPARRAPNWSPSAGTDWRICTPTTRSPVCPWARPGST